MNLPIKYYLEDLPIKTVCLNNIGYLKSIKNASYNIIRIYIIKFFYFFILILFVL